MYAEFKWHPLSGRRNRITRQYEPLQPFILLTIADRFGADTFIDIGANIGVYSIFFSKMPNISKIYSFEAAPETFSVFSENVQMNALQEKIDLRNVAVSSSSGYLEFGIVNSMSGANSVVSTSIHEREKFKATQSVQAIALDEVITFKDRRICIKIDVEGHERSVLAGARTLLSSNRCIVQIEHYSSEDESLIDLEKLGFSLLTRLGPDHYLTNDPSFVDKDTMITVFEDAAALMIKSNRDLKSNLDWLPKDTQQEKNIRQDTREEKSIRRQIFPGIALEVSGAVASALRRAKATFRKAIKRA